MKKRLEAYFTYYMKPTLIICCFCSDLNYLINSFFYSKFVHVLYIILFLVKPLFFFLLFIIFLFKVEVKSVLNYFIISLIIFFVFFGFPVKEYSETYVFSKNFSKFFEEKEYFVDEYMMNHFVSNMVIENIPLLLIIIVNNTLLYNYGGANFFHIFIHLIFIIVYLIAIQHIFNRIKVNKL
jgi:hypothetical protein